MTERNYPLLITLEKIVKVLNVDFVDIFDFEHHNSNENLKNQIIKLLNDNPERLQDFYKIAVALTK